MHIFISDLRVLSKFVYTVVYVTIINLFAGTCTDRPGVQLKRFTLRWTQQALTGRERRYFHTSDYLLQTMLTISFRSRSTFCYIIHSLIGYLRWIMDYRAWILLVKSSKGSTMTNDKILTDAILIPPVWKFVGNSYENLVVFRWQNVRLNYVS